MLSTRSHSVAWPLGTLLIAVPVSLPILVLLVAALAPSSDAWSHLQATVLSTYLVNTLALMILVALLAGALGVATAWITVRYQFPCRDWLVPMLVLPLAAPAYVIGYVYADLLDFSGPVQAQLRLWLDLAPQTAALPNIRSLPGAALVISLVLYPYVYLLARGSFLHQSGALHEAARTLGVSGARLFQRVALPVAWPGIAAGLALVLMETIADYGVVDHYGVPTLTTGIFRTWFAMGESAAALQLAGWLFLLVCLLVLAEQFARRGQRFNPLSRQAPAPQRVVGGAVGWALCLCCALPVLLGLVVPVAALIVMTVQHLDSDQVAVLADLFANSASVAAIAAILCSVFALWLAYAERLQAGYFVRVGVRVATLGYAVPGLVLAVALMGPLLALDKSLARALQSAFEIRPGLLLTGTTAALIFVYVGRFLTVAFNSTQAGLAQVHPQLDAAARSLGASPRRVLSAVHRPLLRSALLTGFLLVFIDVMKELPATLIMRPFNFETLATWVYRFAADERLAQAAPAALGIVLVSLIPTVVLARTGSREAA
jgi:iron(III) transport system permease protein